MVKDDVLKCHDLSTAQRYSEYCQRAVKKTCHHANLEKVFGRLLGNHSCKIVCKHIITCECVQNSLGM